jgi:Bacterial proteasome activator
VEHLASWSAGHRAVGKNDGMTDQPGTMPDEPDDSQEGGPAQVVILGADGQPIATASEDTSESSVADLIEQPAKVMRVGSMIKQLLEEVRSAPLDEASRARLRDIHTRSIKELESGLAPELIEELERLSLPFGSDSTPTDAELRIAQAQLVGWLEGLFHGIQTALFAQQMAARAQFEQMRRAAITANPEGTPPPPDGHRRGTTGPYL